MTAIVLLGDCATLLAAASLFIVGVAVGFGIARRRYRNPARRQAAVVISAAEIERRLKEGAFQ